MKRLKRIIFQLYIHRHTYHKFKHDSPAINSGMHKQTNEADKTVSGT